MTSKRQRTLPLPQPSTDVYVQVRSCEQDGSDAESTRKTAALLAVTAVVGIAALLTLLVNGQLALRRTILLNVEQRKNLSNKKLSNASASQRVNCSGYWELRDVDVREPALARELCCGYQEAFKTDVAGRYPVCELSERPPSQLIDRVAKTAVKLHMTSGLTGRDIAVYAYADGDPVSQSLHQNDHWKRISQSVSVLYSIAKLFTTNVTFLDIGCQVGYHSLQTREAEMPTVAVDANLRNLLRLRMSANNMGWPDDGLLRLLWLHFDQPVSLKFLNFETHRCNVAGADFSQGSEGSRLNDTIPVMSGGADDLLVSVTTQLVVMRIGIAADERAAFLATGGRLFEEKNVVAVHLTSWDFRSRGSVKRQQEKSSPSAKQSGIVTDFFEQHNYALLATNDLSRELNPTEYQDTDTVWVRKDFLRVVIHAQAAGPGDS